MLPSLLIAVSLIFIAINLIYFFIKREQEESYLNTTLLYKLIIVLSALILGFACLYYFLSYFEVVIRVGDPLGEAVDPSFLTYLYFSGVTMLSIGYGDFVPVNHARLFAVIQAGLGILLPTAYFVQAIASRKSE
ncbi:potassium channel LctB [Salsuginibacillus halophilus]|uniref:Potassium channel LctB n=1 Tax=Salsuginibacillus halophilus TaxID=517424 RepID=A0A2P8HY16_9BACI|nr:potassium channel family protein [Salsuginibacillus halophilus]PSL51126.1 potassium channel LctB [Salsuginibacillus halophilus]